MKPARLLLSAAVLCAPVFAQFAGSMNATPGADLSGNWSPAPHDEEVGNPALVEYYGVPINDGARAFGLAWSSSRSTLPEHQCQVHLVSYIYGGPLNLRIWEERDPQSQKVIAIKQYISTYEQNRTIWMDGRPHPSPNAPHTWMGFSTGKWEGDMLTVYTTHIKMGELRRNGLLESDRGDAGGAFLPLRRLLTHVAIVTDPVTLTEPFIRTQTFRLTVRGGAELAVSVRVRGRGGATVRAARCRTICQARIRLSRNMRTSCTFRWKRRWAGRRRCIPSIG